MQRENLEYIDARSRRGRYDNPARRGDGSRYTLALPAAPLAMERAGLASEGRTARGLLRTPCNGVGPAARVRGQSLARKGQRRLILPPSGGRRCGASCVQCPRAGPLALGLQQIAHSTQNAVPTVTPPAAKPQRSRGTEQVTVQIWGSNGKTGCLLLLSHGAAPVIGLAPTSPSREWGGDAWAHHRPQYDGHARTGTTYAWRRAGSVDARALACPMRLEHCGEGRRPASAARAAGPPAS